MNEIVCNYALARFRPYRETGEFVNIGVVLMCPQTAYFGYLFETRQHKRITDFFPALDPEVFKAGLQDLLQELAWITTREQGTQLNSQMSPEEPAARIARFRQLVRPREALFQFGEIGTVLATNPQAKLNELFKRYIQR